MIDKDLANILKQTVLNSNNFSLIVHKNPDGDALGSAYALAFFLQNIKHGAQVFIISPTDIPNNFYWLQDIKKILIYPNAPSDITDAIMHSQIIFMLDFNAYNRMDNIAEIIESTNALKVLIDHHPTPTIHPDLMFSYPKVSSCAEIVWELAKIIDIQSVNKQVAEFAFMGTMSDTGCFCYDSTNPETFERTAQMLNYGIDKNKIINRVYRNYSEDRIRLMGYLLYEKMKIYNHQKVASIIITEQDKELFNYKKGYQEEIVNIPLTIKEVNISFLFLEEDGKFRVSIRSLGKIDVSKIAEKYFSGGGHKNASGGTFYGNYQELTNFFENIVLKQFKL